MKNYGAKRPLWILVAGLVAIGFGLLTIKSGADVLFGSEEARRAAGNYLPSLVWFNLLAGFAYVAAGVGLLFQRRWAAWLALGIAIATLAAFGALGVHLSGGGAYEMRTLAAMLLRTSLWAAIAFLACRAMGCLALRRTR
ncbi:MAG: hypothetical protein A3H35_21630 [Betaproteobacteria bacterium RIFCSPLOWO2_02_FULL_62_17]|nr:MAG: hypothetical protein A3H35_21630 [Betaproteobacteria bacterium RIFCSPLOWO2_02_FULL_62_17]